MDLLSNLNEKLWQNAPTESVQGLVDYVVLKNKMVQPGKFEFALRENRDEGELIMCFLEGAQGKTNPIHAARNVKMKVVNKQIVSIDLEGDCVVKK